MLEVWKCPLWDQYNQLEPAALDFRTKLIQVLLSWQMSKIQTKGIDREKGQIKFLYKI